MSRGRVGSSTSGRGRTERRDSFIDDFDDFYEDTKEYAKQISRSNARSNKVQRQDFSKKPLPSLPGPPVADQALPLSIRNHGTSAQTQRPADHRQHKNTYFPPIPPKPINRPPKPPSPPRKLTIPATKIRSIIKPANCSHKPQLSPTRRKTHSTLSDFLRFRCFKRTMKKFGFGKKSSDADEEKSRTSLFSSRKKADEPVAANPYAQQGSSSGHGTNPYAQQQPNTYARQDRPQQDSGYGGYGGISDAPPAYSNTNLNASTMSTSSEYGGLRNSDSSDRFRREKSPVPSGGYGNSPRPQERNHAAGGGAFPSGASYATQNSYGSDQSRYGHKNDQASPYDRSGVGQRSGGYGGLADEDDRSKLLGGARQARPLPGNDAASYTGSQTEERFSTMPSGNQSYGQGGWLSEAEEREQQRRQKFINYGGGRHGQSFAEMTGDMTEQEKINMETRQIKGEIVKAQYDSVDAMRRTIALAQQSRATAARTNESLGRQNEGLANALSSTTGTKTQARVADEKIDILGRAGNLVLNKKIFGASESKIAQIQADQRLRDNEEREENRKLRYNAAHGIDRLPSQPNKPTSGQSKSGFPNPRYEFVDEDDDADFAHEAKKNEEVLDALTGEMEKLAVEMRQDATAIGGHLAVSHQLETRLEDAINQADSRIVASTAKMERKFK